MEDAATVTTRVVDDGPRGLAAAAALLRSGGLVAFPTETVYGLGADATSDRAVAAIFAAKARPRFNPLIIHVPDLAAAAGLVRLDARAEALAAALWPGPLTLVLPRRADSPVSLLASAGLDTLAVRIPAHPVARRLLAACGLPIAAPSANRSGRVSPTTPQHVLDGLGGRIPMVVAGGRCAVGVESTILDLSTARPVLLRPGGVTLETLTGLLGPVAAPPPPGDRPSAPGQLESHYAPRTPLRMEAAAPRPGEAYLGFGPAPGIPADALNLSPKGDLDEAAANLFAMLRALDRSGATAIAVAPIPEIGLGAAINDRLRRAAAPRPAVDGHDDDGDGP